MSKAARRLAFALPLGLAALPAQASQWTPPDHGFVISVQTPSGIPQKSGSPAQLAATVQAIGVHLRHTTGEGEGKPSLGLQDLLTQDNVQVRAWFPDLTHEVTSNISVKSAGNNLQIGYTTPNLAREDLNVFILQISQLSPATRALEDVQGKLDRRVAALSLRIDQLNTQGVAASDMAELKAFRDRLQAISNRITQKLQSSREILAEARFPLQVDNIVTSSPSLNSTVMGKFRFALSFAQGTAIDGERTTAQATITNLRQPDDDANTLEAPDLWLAKIFWQGALAQQIGPQTIPNGQSVSYTLQTWKLEPENVNDFGAELYAWDSDTGSTGKRFGHLDLVEPTADDQTPPIWLTGGTPDAQHLCVYDMQQINLTAQDAFGLVDPQAFHATLVGALNDGSSVSTDVTGLLSIASPDQGQTLQIHDYGATNPTKEGVYTLSVSGADLAGNPILANPHSTTTRIDRTAAVTNLAVADSIYTNKPYTNKPNISFGVTVLDYFDLCSIKTTVTDNSTQIAQNITGNFTVNSNLADGFHQISASSTNLSNGLTGQTASFSVIVDTLPPTMSGLSPVAGALLRSLRVPVSGNASEALLYAKVNGQSLTLSDDRKSFSGYFLATTAGLLNLHFEVADLATNITVTDVQVTISLKALNGDLLSVQPDTDGNHLLIIGAPGAARPGLTVSATASLLNQGSAVAATDGSFSIRMNPFTQAQVSATDPDTGVTDTATVTFGTGSATALAGMVEDTDHHPLSNVTVSVSGTNLITKTDANGVFKFDQPLTGDRMLVVDGTTADPFPAPSPPRVFSVVHIPITVGLSQSNILQRPIFLQPLLMDGSETTVTASSAVTVTSPHAPGVTLTIPAGAATFPDGSSGGKVSMAQISADVATVPPLAFAEPKSVTALEPSGTTFSQPVDVKLNNVDQLPPGTELVIMSLNSRKGWEIGGTAIVSDDGLSVVSKPGQGLQHFSMIYATPVGARIRQVGDQALSGANTFDGSVTTSISLPGFMALGSTVTPSLTYNSAWAKPTALITNMFDIPKTKVDMVQGVVGTTGNLIKNAISHENCYCTIDLENGMCRVGYEKCFTTWEDYLENLNYSSSVRVEAYYQPDFITAQFFAPGLSTSQPAVFNNVQSQSILSYALELKDPQSGSYVASGVYPYLSRYEVHLKETTITTQKTTVWSNVRPPQIVPQQPSDPETKAVAEVFPTDLSGVFYVQNERSSPAGRGWRISGVQRIVNPGNNRVMIEESNGSISNYSLANTINTVFDANGTSVDLAQGGGFGAWPMAYATGTDETIRKLDLSSGAQSTAGGLPPITGHIYDWFQCYTFFPVSFYYDHAYTVARKTGQLLPLPDGSVFGTDQFTSLLFKIDTSGNYQQVAGALGGAPTIRYPAYVNSGGFAEVYVKNYCVNELGADCPRVGVAFEGNDCTDEALTSTGQVPHRGFDGDGSANTGLSYPMGITAGQGNTLVFADTGNHRVRKVDLSTGAITTVAGNGQLIDSGDGGPATAAGIFHPRGVTYDSVGNLYISTENGLIRKVDTLGYISTFAGVPRGQSGGTVGDQVPASQLILSNPYGLVADSNYLYIADTGANLVRRIDFQTQTAVTVAGNGASGFNGDNQPALAAALSAPTHLGLDPSGNLLIMDSGNQRIRRVIFENSSTGVLAFASTTRDLSHLDRDADGTWTRSYRNGVQIFFDSQGRETLATDRVGRQTSYSYNSAGQLTAITYPSHATTQYNYSGAQLTSITDPAGRTTKFGFDGSGSLISVTFPDGAQRNYAYDSTGLLVSETNERGKTTTYAYNPWNRLESVTRPDGSVQKVSDSGSKAVSNNYTGGVVGRFQSFGLGPDQIYDGVTDVRGSETKFVKTYNGYLTTIVGSDGRTMSIQRDASGQPIKVTRPDGTIQIFIYDPTTNDLVSQSDTATGVSTSQTYDTYGNLLTQTNANSQTTTFSYDPMTGLPLSVTDPLNRTSSRTYVPGAGLVASATNFLNQTTSFGYDVSGNLISVTDPLKHQSQYTYDAAGNQISAKDANGNTTLFEYDAFNRLTAVVTPKGERTEYTYLPTGRLLQVKDALGNISQHSYDDLGRVIQTVDALGFSTLFSYDVSGNLKQVIDPNGAIKQFAYDSNNRLIQKTLPDNVVNITYDSQGRMTQVTDLNSEIDFSFDVVGRVTSTEMKGLGSNSSLPDVKLAFGYSLTNKRVSMTDPEGVTQYTYDTVDRPTSLTNPKGEAFSLAYDDTTGGVTSTRPGSKTVLAVDSAGFLSSIIHSSSSATIDSFALIHDPAGNISQINTPAGSRAIAYDKDNQVTSMSSAEAPSSSGMSAETFQYDGISNRVQDQLGSFQYDSKSQRLAQDYRYFYFYDNNGNLLSKQAKGLTGDVTNFFYSSENQLLGFKVYVPGVYDPSTLYAPGSNTPTLEVTYLYDALGRRIQKQVIDHTAPADPTRTFTRRYVLDGNSILLEYDQNNALLARYTYSPVSADALLAADIRAAGVAAGLAQQAQSYFYLKDNLGSIADIADGSGALVQHYVYSAYGELLAIRNSLGQDVTAAPPVRTTYGFTGRELDPESGLMYFRARYYSPAIGRFIQRDASPGRLGVPISVTNGYVYASNNPVNLTDPTGNSIFDDIGDFFKGAVAQLALIFVAPLVGLYDVGRFGSSLMKKIVFGTFAIAAATVTGGLAGPALAGVLVTGGSTALATGIGAVVGGIVAGTLNVLTGNGTFLEGFIQGAIAGGLAAYSAASNASLAANSEGESASESAEQDGWQSRELYRTAENEYGPYGDPHAVMSDAPGGLSGGTLGAGTPGVTAPGWSDAGLIEGWRNTYCAVGPWADVEWAPPNPALATIKVGAQLLNGALQCTPP